MKRSLRFIIIRHLISLIIVISLCSFYFYQTGRLFVWFFVLISLIPIVISFLDYQTHKRELEQKEVLKDNDSDQPNGKKKNK